MSQPSLSHTPLATTAEDIAALSFRRFRRLRSQAWARDVFTELRLAPADLIQPVFVYDEAAPETAGSVLPGQDRLTPRQLEAYTKRVAAAGIRCMAVIPCIASELRTEDAREAFNEQGLLANAVSAIKSACPDMGVMSDIALDLFSADGHDGVVDPATGCVRNDETVALLVQQSLCHARMGIDVLSLSDMMDGRVKAIRQALDAAGQGHMLLFSHSAKQASALYGPYRKAVNFRPRSKPIDKDNYQLSCANTAEALREFMADQSEDADAVVVKPAMFSLDMIARVKDQNILPIVSYQVSSEYAMIKSISEGDVGIRSPLWESLIGCKRAGSDAIISYGALEMAEHLQ